MGCCRARQWRQDRHPPAGRRRALPPRRHRRPAPRRTPPAAPRRSRSPCTRTRPAPPRGTSRGRAGTRPPGRGASGCSRRTAACRTPRPAPRRRRRRSPAARSPPALSRAARSRADLGTAARELVGERLPREPRSAASAAVGRSKRSPAATRDATCSCARRNGTPSRTSCSATSVATVVPSPAAAAIRSPSNRRPSTHTRSAASAPSRSSIWSNAARLSSCRSRLYASGSPLSVASRPASRPIAVPALPRASSAASGFFFCGIIELPVAAPSSSSAKPYSADVHSTSSSPSRDRWTKHSAEA